MKKITLFLCSALLVLAACNKHQNEYTINGHLDDADFEGKTVYLYDAFQGTELHSAVITNGAFTFKDTVGEPMLVSIRTNEEDMNYNLLVVLEPGTTALRTAAADIERAISSAKPITRALLVPGAGSSSYKVTTGPGRTLTILP